MGDVRDIRNVRRRLSPAVTVGLIANEAGKIELARFMLAGPVAGEDDRG